MSIFDKIQRSDDSFIEELELNMALEKRAQKTREEETPEAPEADEAQAAEVPQEAEGPASSEAEPQPPKAAEAAPQDAAPAADPEQQQSREPENPAVSLEGQTAVVSSVDARREEMEALYSKKGAMLWNGDETPAPRPKSKPSLEQQMAALGFPDRPKLWPAVMAWPMQPDFDLLIAGRVTREKVQEYIASMEVEKQRMLERAEQVNAYILQNSPVEERAGWINRRQSRKFLDATRDDPHYGIYWASLIDEKSTRPSAAIVREWAHHRAVTNDGGVVFANRDYISFKQITQQAVSLAVQEGVARGWGTINMQGDRRFALAAIEAAKQANVKAEIYELYGPWNLFKRKHTIMPTPPGVNKEQPRVETEDLTTGGAEGAPAEGKRETLERMAKLPNRDVPDNPEQENEDPFAALDNPETDEVDTTVAEQEGDDMVWTDEGKVGPIRTPGPNMA